MTRSKIKFEDIGQVDLFDDQIIIEDVPDRERPIDTPTDPDAPLVVLAGQGSSKNPKNNTEEAGIYLVRRVGDAVTRVKDGDWVLMKWTTVNPKSPDFMDTFGIREGNFAVTTEGGVAGKLTALSRMKN